MKGKALKKRFAALSVNVSGKGFCRKFASVNFTSRLRKNESVKWPKRENETAAGVHFDRCRLVLAWISMDSLEALRSRLDLLDLCRDYLRDLKRSGKSWSACCPFHEEKTPSFHISPERGLYYCFGCSAGGDAIKFYMQMENVGFMEAVEALCERVGLPKPAARAARGEEKWREQIRKALDLTADFYAGALSLREDVAAELARDYLIKTRRLTLETIKIYKLGLAPKGPAWLLTTLVTKHGIEPGILEKAGLVSSSTRDGKYIDFFRNRIVFPVFDTQGKITGFGGRNIGDGAYGPKYLNSPDTTFFHKSDILYGLAAHKEEMRKKDKAYLVEGYFDVVGLAQAGLPMAAAPMGGSLTANQARLLKRFVTSVVILFDPDAAGIAGSVRAGRILLGQGLQVRVLQLPAGMDPDEYVFAYGKETFEDLERRESKDFLDFELAARRQQSEIAALGVPEGLSRQQHLGTKRSLDQAGRLALAREMMPSLSVIAGEMERREAVIRVAQALRLDAVGLERELLGSRENTASGVLRRPNTALDNASVLKPRQWDLSLEESLLTLAFSDPIAVSQALQEAQLTSMDFDNARIGHCLFSAQDPRVFSGPKDEQWQALLSRLALVGEMESQKFTAERLTDYVRELKCRKLARELKTLRETMDFKRSRGETCEPAMLERVIEISKILKKKF